jgi:hypothetical protein
MVVAWPVCLLVELTPDDERVAAAFTVLTRQRSPEAVLDVLASQGLSQMPSFGLVAFGPTATRVIVRGRVSAAVEGLDQITSGGLMAEVEVALDQAVRLSLAGSETVSGQSWAGAVALTAAGWLLADPSGRPVSAVSTGSVGAVPPPTPAAEVASSPRPSRAIADDPVATDRSEAGAAPGPDSPAPPAVTESAAVASTTSGPPAAPVAAVPPVAPAPAEPGAELESGATGFAHLFSATMPPPPELAAAAPAEADSAAAPAAVESSALPPSALPLVDDSHVTPRGLGLTQVAPATASLSEIAREADQAPALAGPAVPAAPSTAGAASALAAPAPPPAGGFIASFDWRPNASSVSIDALPSSQISVQPEAALSWPQSVPVAPPDLAAGPSVTPAPPAAVAEPTPVPDPAALDPTPAVPDPVGPTPVGPTPVGPSGAVPGSEPGSSLGQSGPAPSRPVAPAGPPLDASSPIVGAVYCPARHLNPPYADVCRVCRQPVPQQQPVELPRPSLGVLRLSSGGVVNLDRGAVLGRNPRPLANGSGLQPNLIRIADANRDISGQHLEVRLEDWFVTVRDLGSTNGTQVIAPDRPPVTLRAHEPVSIEPGARVVLANAFDFVFEALP